MLQRPNHGLGDPRALVLLQEVGGTLDPDLLARGRHELGELLARAGNGNTGSLSENATSTGLSHSPRAARTARISAAPTSASDVGTRNGNRWTPALLSAVG